MLGKTREYFWHGKVQKKTSWHNWDSGGNKFAWSTKHGWEIGKRWITSKHHTSYTYNSNFVLKLVLIFGVAEVDVTSCCRRGIIFWNDSLKWKRACTFKKKRSTLKQGNGYVLCHSPLLRTAGFLKHAEKFKCMSLSEGIQSRNDSYEKEVCPYFGFGIPHTVLPGQLWLWSSKLKGKELRI